MKIYLSGRMTGVKGKNKALFNRAEKEYEKSHEVVNPHKLDIKRRGRFDKLAQEKKEQGFKTGQEWWWCQYLRDDIKHLVDCDAIVMLPGWEKSKGAILEEFIATSLGLEVWYD